MRREYRERRLSDRVAKDAAFVLFSVMLVLCLALFISETVISQTEGNITVDEKHIQVLEQEYVSEIREYLDAAGYRNSGVTLTKVVDTDGSRSYSVTLHHKGLHKLEQAEQEALFQKVEDLAFQVAGCDFQVELLG